MLLAHGRLQRDAASWAVERTRAGPPDEVTTPITTFWQGRRAGLEGPLAMDLVLQRIRDLRRAADLRGLDISGALPGAEALARLSVCRSITDEPCASTLRDLDNLAARMGAQ